MNINIKKYLTTPVATDFAYTIVRVMLGVFLVVHGTQKLQDGLGQFSAKLAERGWPFPELQAFMAMYTEFAGGVLLIVGLFTRPVALINVALFMVITYGWHAADGFAKQEKPLMFLIISLFIVLCGPGKWSVDHNLFSTRNAAQKQD